MFSRRDFLGAGTLAAAGFLLDPRTACARGLRAGTSASLRRMTPGALLPEPPSVALLQRLAQVAVDAARASGAAFADVRMGVRRSIGVGGPPTYGVYPELVVSYGIRARVRGTWGFQYGSVLTDDAVASAARGASAGAARNAAANNRLGRTTITELAPVPVVTGEWHGPNVIDPFTVPIDDYIRAMGLLAEQLSSAHRNYFVGAAGFLGWTADTRVFASTEGSFVTQHRMFGGPIWKGNASLPNDPGDAVDVDLPGLEPVLGGFEVALRPERIEYLRRGVDEAAAIRALPMRPFMDTGRFPVVLTGRAFADVCGATVSMALDGDRVSGAEADASGTTFLVPPDVILGATIPQFSPLLTVRADRPSGSWSAAQWDDEGVVPEPYTLIDRGRVVDYHTTRETAPLLASWYRERGRPLGSHGTAVAESPGSWPVGTGGYVHVAPSAGVASVTTLARGLAHGFVLRTASAVTESGLTLLTIRSWDACEVRNGAIVARTKLTLQAPTKPLLSDKLVALGDASTVRAGQAESSKGIPWVGVRYPVSAPAALCKDLDVVSWGAPR